MDFTKLIEQLVPLVGQKAADALLAQVQGLITDQSPAWQKTVLAFVADSIEKHGVGGIQIAIKEVEALLDGDATTFIDWTNLMVASDLVALLQRAEAQEKSAIQDFLVKLGEVLGSILSGILRGLLKG